MNIDIKIQLAREDEKEYVVYLRSLDGSNIAESFKTKKELKKIVSDFINDMISENVKLSEV